MTPELKTAIERQRMAADPRDSVYVSANAGSGKTRVLVGRVSRLLLAGTLPAKILCLTYTKAAANEMQARLYQTLGKWSVMGDEELQLALEALDGSSRRRSVQNLRDARELFAKALETPEGLKVQTIHAFCERLLRRFPVEAGIAPGYEAMDDRDQASVLAGVKSELYKAARAEPSGELARSISALAARNADGFLDGLFSWSGHHSYKIAQWEGQGLSPLAARLGVDENITLSGAARDGWVQAPRAELKSAAADLAASGKNNQKTAQLIYDALTAPDDERAFDIYSNVFLTASGSLRKSVSYSGVADALFGGEKNGYGLEVARMMRAIEIVKAAATLEQTRAVYVIATRASKAYQQAKRARRLMDFTDQIMLAKNLLTRSQAREWVTYKLDGGVDHVLIDEAQDTAPEQWEIVDAVCAEFEAIEGSGRTKFAVGDEKQSIYSFQGADPEVFLERTQSQISENVNTKVIPLTMSFRSAPNVLRVVDAVFADCGAAAQIFNGPPAGDLPRHIAHRSDEGRVELWPLTPRPEAVEDEQAWDFAPVDKQASQSSREQLARQIAIQVKGWLSRGEAVYDRDNDKLRPITPGDIMILVRKRSAFFDAVIRHLKLAGVAVAGADKLKLTDNIGVQDLISLGKFLCLPGDDLSLAEVLKSPIFGLDDTALMKLSFQRDDEGKASLWDMLNTQSDPLFFEARSVLRKIVAFAPGHAPYELYARILSTLMPVRSGEDDPSRQSVLKRIYMRLGQEAADPIESFLSRALAHQRSGPPSLDRFLRELEGDGSTLKREMDAGKDDVRVMTVHGAKGLEAPIVILPDTTQVDKARARGFEMETLKDEGFVLRQSADDTPEALADLSDRRERAAMQESLRLLYVAMTRAESRLCICGFESGSKTLAEGSWYDWAQRAFTYLEQTPNAVQVHDGDIGQIKAFGPAHTANLTEASSKGDHGLEGWASRPAPAEGSGLRRVTPSHLLAPDAGLPAMRSPLDNLRSGNGASSASGLGRFGRGNMIHKLLEILPDAPPERRPEIARSYLSAQPEMSPDLQTQIIDEVFAVLNAPEFAAIFGPGTRGEVCLAGSASGLPEGLFVNAQIDRLAVTDKEVWIVDYKSNRPPPKTQDDVAQIYIAQLAAYRALARDIYPKKQVRCALLWTDGPFLMDISSQKLDQFDLTRALTC